jgi:hypothetical protein
MTRLGKPVVGVVVRQPRHDDVRDEPRTRPSLIDLLAS